MEKRLKDRVAVVTGGGQGIGRAISLRLAREGADVVIVEINATTANQVVTEGLTLGRKAIALYADVIDRPQVNHVVRETVQAMGKIDIWVNNVGGRRNTQLSRIVDMKEEVWDAVIANNLKSTFLCSQAAAREMIRRRSGKIINIASLLGKTGVVNVGHYAAAKAAVIRFTDVLAKELGPYGIQVNAVCPGYVDTPALRESLASLTAEGGKTFEEIMAEMAVRDIPLGRSEMPEDVANVVAFLCSDDASYMTGQAINVTGGQEVH